MTPQEAVDTANDKFHPLLNMAFQEAGLLVVTRTYQTARDTPDYRGEVEGAFPSSFFPACSLQFLTYPCIF